MVAEVRGDRLQALLEQTRVNAQANRFAIIGQEHLCWYKIYVKKLNVYVYGSKYKRLVERDGTSTRFGSVQYFVQVDDAMATTVIIHFKVNTYNARDQIHSVTPSCVAILLQEIINCSGTRLC